VVIGLILSVLWMLKDFPRSLQIVTYAVKVIISHKGMTGMIMSYQITPFPTTFMTFRFILIFTRVSIFRTLLHAAVEHCR